MQHLRKKGGIFCFIVEPSEMYFCQKLLSKWKYLTNYFKKEEILIPAMFLRLRLSICSLDKRKKFMWKTIIRKKSWCSSVITEKLLHKNKYKRLMLTMHIITPAFKKKSFRPAHAWGAPIVILSLYPDGNYTLRFSMCFLNTLKMFVKYSGYIFISMIDIH